MHSKATVWYARCIVICLSIVMLTIPMRFVLRNIVYERMGICEPWMKYFMVSDAELLDNLEKNETDKNYAEKPVMINWEEWYPFSSEDSEPTEVVDETFGHKFQRAWNQYEELIHAVEGKLEYYCEEGLFFYHQAVAVASKLEHMVGLEASASGDVLQMNNGYLTYMEPECPEEDIQEIADEVQDFDAFLKSMDIPFFYANAGSKVCPYDRQLSDGVEEYTNQNGTALLTALQKRGVDTLDFREKMQADHLDWYDSYYKTDHHWKTETGLWAAGKLAEKLNEEADLNFDAAMFEKENYRFDTFETCFLGGQGRSVSGINAQIEDYTRILPAFDTRFSLQIPTRSVDLTGSYEQVLFDADRMEQILSYSANDHMNRPGAYDCARARNDALVHIRNLNAPDNADQTILLLQDSFSWYSTSFLACDIGAVDIIHPGAFSGSIRAYIQKTKPDAVVLMYCERNIKPIDWTTHESAFDLR